jgi:hypothetical protein
VISAKFFIDHSDQAYPKIRFFRGQDIADGVTRFNTLGEAKKVLLQELISMREHYAGLIEDVRRTTLKYMRDDRL